MTIPDLLDSVTQSGGRLIVDGDALTLEAPEPLAAAIIDAIRQHKAAIIGHLRAERCPQCATSEIFAGGPVRVCQACRHEWLMSCPHCAGASWGMPKGRWTCTACDHTWKSHIDLGLDVPTALDAVQHPDGYDITVAIYRCAGCRGTNWGPKLDDPETWWCLNCHRSGCDAPTSTAR